MIKIIPAVDILEDKCVRLYQGRYDKATVYANDPLDMALRWEEQGAVLLHVVDLDGARDGRPVNWRAVERITNRTGLRVQLGGGIRSQANVEEMLSIGVEVVVLGTSLVAKPEEARGLAGSFKGQVAAGLDAKDGKVAVSGWEENTKVDVLELAAELDEVGFARFIHTDISVDGTQEGANVEATRRLAEAVNTPVVASGGIGSLADIEALLPLEAVGVEGVIVGKALYEGSFTLREALDVVRSSC